MRVRKKTPFGDFLERAGLGRRSVHTKVRGMLFSQGTTADSIFYLQKGRARPTVVSKNEKEATITLLGAGDFVGEGSLAAGGRLHMAMATSITGCTPLSIERDKLLQEHAYSDLFLRFLLPDAQSYSLMSARQ